MQTDYAGPTVEVTDPQTGEIRQAHLRYGWGDFRNNTVAIGDQNRLAAGDKPNIVSQLILERFETNRARMD